MIYFVIFLVLCAIVFVKTPKKKEKNKSEPLLIKPNINEKIIFNKEEPLFKTDLEKIEEKDNDIESICIPTLKKRNLLSKKEFNFYLQLKNIISPQNNILCKVRVDDVITTEDQGFRNRLKSRHFDFIIWNTEINKIISIIELDDLTHKWQKAINADKLKNIICEKTKMKMIRIVEKNCYNFTKAEIKNINEEY